MYKCCFERKMAQRSVKALEASLKGHLKGFIAPKQDLGVDGLEASLHRHLDELRGCNSASSSTSSSTHTPKPGVIAEYRYGSSGRLTVERRIAPSQSVAKRRRKSTQHSQVATAVDVVEPELSSEQFAAGDPDIQPVDTALADLEASLAEHNDALSEGNEKAQRGWQERMDTREENWATHRSSLFEHFLSLSGEDAVSTCSYCAQPARIRCSDCGPCVMLCKGCDSHRHRAQPLHDREAWVGYFRSISPSQTVTEEGTIVGQVQCISAIVGTICPCCHIDGSLESVPTAETCIVVTRSGRFDLNIAATSCTECGFLTEPSCPRDALKLGYWPGGPIKSKYLFDFTLLDTFDLLQKQMPGVSVSGFLRVLESLSEKRGRVGCINAVTFSKAFEEWRYLKHEILCLQRCSRFTCPCCFSEQHSVSLDGNRKLYRYSKVPRGSRPQYYVGDFIASNEDVDAHLNRIGYGNEVHCGAGLCGTTRWKAAKSSSKTLANLDEAGLEVAGCRHVVAQKAINMFRGEIFGYPHYLHMKYFTNVQCVWGDVICRYWPWALAKTTTLKNTPCLSVMHAKAHSWHCQLLWGGRWQDGAAASTGEDMEQLFSYLSRLNLITKNMSAARREEHITEAAAHWNERKVERLPQELRKRFVKTRAQLTAARTQLKALTEEEQLSDGDCLSFKLELQTLAKGELAVDTELFNAEAVEYFQLKQQVLTGSLLGNYLASTNEALSIVAGHEVLYNAVSSVLLKLPEAQGRLQELQHSLAERGVCDLDSETISVAATAALTRYQEQMEMLYLFIQRRQEEITSKATSSKQRSGLRRTITDERKKLAQLCHKYNSVISKLQLATPTVTEEEVCSGEFPWSQLSSRHSASTQRKLRIANAYTMVKRLEEEELLLVHEMTRFVQYFYNEVLIPITQDIADVEDELLVDDGPATVGIGVAPPLRYQYTGRSAGPLKGKLAFLRSGLHSAKCHIASAHDQFLSKATDVMEETVGFDSEDIDGNEQIDDDEQIDEDDSDASTFDLV